LPIDAQDVLNDIINNKPINIDNDTINGNIDLYQSNIKVVASSIKITNSKINGSIVFSRVEFKDEINFMGTNFGRNAYFWDCTFKTIYFSNSEFCGDTDFSEVSFNENVYFWRSMFKGGAYFKKVHFFKNAIFWGSRFLGESLTFRDSKFNRPEDQEDACRRAKRVLEESGNKDEADYHYFREMEARRLQKTVNSWDFLSNYFDYEVLLVGNFPITSMPSFIKFLKYNLFEFIFVQKIFGYGINPYRVITTWFFVVFILGIFYLLGQGVEKSSQSISFFEYFYFSIITAATPGYGGYTPKPGIYTIVAGAEAIFGVFMWGAFISTFTRKYMR